MRKRRRIQDRTRDLYIVSNDEGGRREARQKGQRDKWMEGETDVGKTGVVRLRCDVGVYGLKENETNRTEGKRPSSDRRGRVYSMMRR